MLGFDSIISSSICCHFTIRSWSLNSVSRIYLLISLNICSYLMCACLDCSIFASIFFCFKYACINIATVEIATKANPFVAIQ